MEVRNERKALQEIASYLGFYSARLAGGGCGAAARTRQTQRVPDVESFPGHIACSSTTRSEIVIPVLTPEGRLLAVLDVDSDLPAAFDETDQRYLEQLCHKLGAQFAGTRQR